MIKIFTMPLAMNGCSWYRVYQPFKQMVKLDLADCAVIMQEDIGEFEANALEVIEMADVIVWRHGHEQVLKTILRDFDCSKKVIVFDADDNDFESPYWQEHYRYYGTTDVFYTDKDGKSIPVWVDKDSPLAKDVPEDQHYDRAANLKKIEDLKEMVIVSDAVVVTTKELGDLYRTYNPNIIVIPNTINLATIKPVEIAKKGFRLGWTGGGSHYEDFYEYAQVIKDFINAHSDAKLVVAGDPPKSLFKDMDADKIEIYGWIPPEAHGYRLPLLNIDVAVIPLKPSNFSNCKSAIKYCEFSAIKVPCVVSNTTPYKEVIQDRVNGLLFSTPKELRLQLEELYKDKVLRMYIANKAYQNVTENFDLDMWTKVYADKLNKLSEEKKGKDNGPISNKE